MSSQVSVVFNAEERLGYIYVVTNTITREQYVGLTYRTPEQRWKDHVRFGSEKEHRKFYRAIKKYGADCFHLATLDHLPLSQLCEAEKYWIRKLNTIAPNGYNLTSGGEENKVFSEETRLRQSASHLGKTPWNKGKTFSDEYRAKLSNARKGKYGGDKHPLFGVPCSQETKERIRAANTGSKRTDEVKARISAANKERCQNPEFQQQMVQSQRESWSDPVKRAARIAKMNATRQRNKENKSR